MLGTIGESVSIAKVPSDGTSTDLWHCDISSLEEVQGIAPGDGAEACEGVNLDTSDSKHSQRGAVRKKVGKRVNGLSKDRKLQNEETLRREMNGSWNLYHESVGESNCVTDLVKEVGEMSLLAEEEKAEVQKVEEEALCGLDGALTQETRVDLRLDTYEDLLHLLENFTDETDAQDIHCLRERVTDISRESEVSRVLCDMIQGDICKMTNKLKEEIKDWNVEDLLKHLVKGHPWPVVEAEASRSPANKGTETDCHYVASYRASEAGEETVSSRRTFGHPSINSPSNSSHNHCANVHDDVCEGTVALERNSPETEVSLSCSEKSDLEIDVSRGSSPEFWMKNNQNSQWNYSNVHRSTDYYSYPWLHSYSDYYNWRYNCEEEYCGVDLCEYRHNVESSYYNMWRMHLQQVRQYIQWTEYWKHMFSKY
ncbi:hypothetical protein B7P43_G14963 [Cryptotermes secundus]|nr:hypothetical protein B7P43_G14963 [Cryptotermes secundus]